MKKYLNYQKSRNLTWEVLIKHNISSLPVDIEKILNEQDIKLLSYIESKELLQHLNLNNYTESDGFGINNGNVKIIFFNSEIKPKERIRFTIAHELGHILLHGKTSPINDGNMHKENTIEFEANIFASRLLAPACILHEIKCFNANDIADLCGLSKSAAMFRANRLKQLEERNKFYLSPLERKVKEQFKDFINVHNKS